MREKEDETNKQEDLKLCLSLLADTLLGKETGLDLTERHGSFALSYFSAGAVEQSGSLQQ